MRNHRFTVPSLRVALAVSLLLSTLTSGASSHAASSDATNPLSLARAFPIEKLTAILIPRDQWHPFPALKDRERWQALPKPVTTHLLALGEEALAKPVPPLPATLYLAYARNGNRSVRKENVGHSDLVKPWHSNERNNLRAKTHRGLPPAEVCYESDCRHS